MNVSDLKDRKSVKVNSTYEKRADRQKRLKKRKKEQTDRKGLKKERKKERTSRQTEKV